MEQTSRLHGRTRPSPAFPFEGRFLEVNGHRIHYVEEGKGAPVLFVHGNPTWSYLWRNVLAKVAADTGTRAVALDLLGFGRSDKPSGAKYTLDLHASVLTGFIEKLGLDNLVLVLHDWGGPLGMWYATHHPDAIRGIVLLETFLWDVSWKDFGKYRLLFRLMRSSGGYLMLQVMNLFVNRILRGSVVRREHMTVDVMERYREPFPTVASRKAVRTFPRLIPIEGRPEASLHFVEEINGNLSKLACPLLWIKATPGAIITDDTEYHLTALSALLPRLFVQEFGPGLHYLPEDDPQRLADLITGWMRSNRLLDRPPETVLRPAA